MYLQTNYITLISRSFFQKSLHKFVIRFISAFFDFVQMQRLKLVLHSLLLLFIASALKSHIYFQNQIYACKIIPPVNPIPKWCYVIFKWRVFFVNYRPYRGILRRLQAIIETFTPVFHLKKSKFFFSNLGYILLDPFYGKQIFKIHAQGDLDCRFLKHGLKLTLWYEFFYDYLVCNSGKFFFAKIQQPVINQPKNKALTP